MRMLRIVLAFGLLAVSITAPAYTGTFNYFDASTGNNTGFCRMQAYRNHSRSSTFGPRLLRHAHVFSGARLSQALFNDGAVCGMCLEVTAKMMLWDCELTHPQHELDPIDIHNASAHLERKA